MKRVWFSYTILIFLSLALTGRPAFSQSRPSADEGAKAAKGIEDLTLEELDREVKKLDQDLGDLELNTVSRWFLDNGSNFTTAGILAVIWNSVALLPKMKERQDLENQRQERLWQAHQVRELLGEHRGMLERLKGTVQEMRDFVGVMDTHVRDLERVIDSSFSDRADLLRQAREAIREWNAEHMGGRRSRVKLDAFMDLVQAETRQNASHPFQTWKTAFELLDVDLNRATVGLYEADHAFWRKIRERYPFFPVQPLAPVRVGDRLVPDQIGVQAELARERLRQARETLTYEEAVNRTNTHCTLALRAIMNDLRHIGRASHVIYGVYVLAGGFVVGGAVASNAKNNHQSQVDDLKARRKQLEESRQKKNATVETAARTLESQIVQALKKDASVDKDAKSLKDLAQITAQVLKRHKSRVSDAITRAYHKDPDWPLIRERLDRELEKLENPEAVLRFLPLAIPETLRARNSSHANLSDVILFLGTGSSLYQETEVFDFLMLYYGGMIQRILTQVRPRVSPSDSLTRPISGFEIEPLARDTMRRISGLPFQLQDPRTAAPTAVTTPPSPAPLAP